MNQKMQASQSHLLADKDFVYEKWFMPYRWCVRAGFTYFDTV